jgi:hypothetical protein
LRLPRGREAIVDRRKLVDYALSVTHPRGRHKARVFASVLGLTASDADVLAEALRGAAADQHAAPMHADAFGARYQIEFEFRFRSRSAIIVSAWLSPPDASAPRLLTVFVKP